MVAWKPIFRVTLSDGSDATADWNDRLISMTVEIESGDGQPDRLEAVFDDRSLNPMDQTGWALDLPTQGAEIAVDMGYEINGAPMLVGMGSYTIDQLILEGPPKQLRMVAVAASMNDETKEQALTEFEGKTVGEIVTTLAGFGGYTPIIDPRYQSVKVHYVNQITSHWHMLHELERRFGAVAKVQFGSLIFVPRDYGMSDSWANAMGGNPVSHVQITPQHLAKWMLMYEDRSNYANVEAHWRDKDGHIRVAETIPFLAGVAAQNFTLGRIFNTQVEAQEAAKSKANAMARAMLTGTIDLAKGDPWIRAQMPLTISGLRPGIDGNYIVNKATHTLVKDIGIQTSLEINTPGDLDSITSGGGLIEGSGGWFGGQVGQEPRGDN